MDSSKTSSNGSMDSYSSSGSHNQSRKRASNLEDVAETFQEQMFEQGLIKDRYDGTKNIARSFLGKDAVTVLVSILQEGEETPTSSETAREQALQVGREIAKQFRFFAHHAATKKVSSLVLEDSDNDIYIFQNNLPIQVNRMKKRFPSPWDRVKLLEEFVQVKDRKGVVRVLSKCFVASEAVDVLMNLKLAKTRGEAVYMMQKMNDKVNFFTFAVSNLRFEFQDERDMYLQFVPEESRRPEPKKRQPVDPQSPRRNSPRRIQKAKSMDGSNGNNGSVSPKFRKAKTVGHTGPLRSPSVGGSDEVTSTAPTSSTKDKAYFENRAKSVRSRLDAIRSQRLAANAAA